MNKLLKANFYKLAKEKSIFILMGVSLIVSLIAIIIYKIIGNFSIPALQITGVVNGEMLFLSGIQLGQNAGMLMGLGIAIYVGKEFSQNTIRNKIVVGYSKTKIYLANLITSISISAILYVVYELAAICVGVPMFGWGESFVFADFFRQLINSLFILITVSAVVNMVGMLTRSMVTSILITMLGIIMLSAIFSAINVIPIEGSAKTVVEIILKSNFLGQSVLIGSVNTVSFMVWVIISSIIVSAGTTVLGCYLFEKMDVK